MIAVFVLATLVPMIVVTSATGAANRGEVRTVRRRVAVGSWLAVAVSVEFVLHACDYRIPLDVSAMRSGLVRSRGFLPPALGVQALAGAIGIVLNDRARAQSLLRRDTRHRVARRNDL